jgi:hypothetical protein
MIAHDPDALGIAFQYLDNVVIDKRLITREDGDKEVLNEEFFRIMIDDYNKMFDIYRPGILERRYKDRVIDFVFANYRNDPAYFERIGALITWIIINRDVFTDKDGDYTTILNEIRDFWKNGNEKCPGDNRKRTQEWIDWVFRFVIRKYRRKIKNNFYRKSVNHFLMFICANAQKWMYTPAFDPENWYGNGRGVDTIALYGGVF